MGVLLEKYLRLKRYEAGLQVEGNDVRDPIAVPQAVIDEVQAELDEVQAQIDNIGTPTAQEALAAWKELVGLDSLQIDKRRLQNILNKLQGN